MLGQWFTYGTDEQTSNNHFERCEGAEVAPAQV